MIVGCRHELEIGSVRKMIVDQSNLKDINQKFIQPIYIIRKATFEEYLNDCINTLGPPPEGYDYAREKKLYFYEVSID